MQSLLGADFLCSNTLMVDVKGQQLVNPTTYTSLPLQVTNASAHGIHNVAHDNNFSALLTKFPDILTPTFSNPTARHGSSTTSPLMVLRSTVVQAGFQRRN